MEPQFKDLGLSEKTLSALKRMHFETPTAVQARSIPLAMSGKDLAVSAQTGTGKTAAFGLPVLERSAARKGKAPSALIISPTRELAMQINSFLTGVARVTGHRITPLIGGVPYGKQIANLKRGTDVVVATPGRLLDMMERHAVNLSHIEVLVLDEADRMLDMGFWPTMQKVIQDTPDTRQTLLFSATLDRKLLGTVNGILNDPELIEVSHKGDTADKVDQFIVPVSHKRKPDVLRTVLEEKGSTRTIVFARTKSRSDVCAEQLCRAGYQAEAIHSDLSQGQRKRALENFRRGKTNILVATDVLARGIHVTGVERVINYDLPDCADDYIHRIGRTGRAGKAGDAISFVSSDSRSTWKEIEKLVGKSIPCAELDGYDSEKELAGVMSGKGGTKNYKGSYGRKPGQGFKGSRGSKSYSGNKSSQGQKNSQGRKYSAGKPSQKRSMAHAG